LNELIRLSGKRGYTGNRRYALFPVAGCALFGSLASGHGIAGRSMGLLRRQREERRQQKRSTPTVKAGPAWP
jgi:hypothetical protein